MKTILTTPQENRLRRFLDERYAARSREFLNGCFYGLCRKAGFIEQPKDCPYPLRSAQADAWLAGNDAGRQVYQVEEIRDFIEQLTEAGKFCLQGDAGDHGRRYLKPIRN